MEALIEIVRIGTFAEIAFGIFFASGGLIFILGAALETINQKSGRFRDVVCKDNVILLVTLQGIGLISFGLIVLHVLSSM